MTNWQFWFLWIFIMVLAFLNLLVMRNMREWQKFQDNAICALFENSLKKVKEEAK